MKKAQKIAKYSVIFTVLAVIMGVGVFYHQNAISGLENELKAIREEKGHLEKFKKDATTSTPTPEEILAEVNKLRADVGVSPVILDNRLNASALLKAQDMVTYNYYDHSNPSTGKRGVSYIYDVTGNECVSTAENLARGSVERTAKERALGWKESEPHYKAMIDPQYTKIGFAEIFDHGVKVEAATMAVLHMCREG